MSGSVQGGSEIVVASQVVDGPAPNQPSSETIPSEGNAPAVEPTQSFDPEVLWSPDVVVNVPETQSNGYTDVGLPIGLALLNALLISYLVHHLTSKREQRKEVIALQRAIAEAAHEARDTALKRWEEKTQTKRDMLVSQTRMDLQRVGSLVGQLEVESSLRQLRKKPKTITLSDDVGRLRENILTDEFEDKKLGVNDTRRRSVIEQTGLFVMRLDTEVVDWMRA